MKFGTRKSSIKKTTKSRAPGTPKKTAKRPANSANGKKGMGWVNNTQLQYGKAAFGSPGNAQPKLKAESVRGRLPAFLLGVFVLFLGTSGTKVLKEKTREQNQKESQYHAQMSDQERREFKRAALIAQHDRHTKAEKKKPKKAVQFKVKETESRVSVELGRGSAKKFSPPNPIKTPMKVIAKEGPVLRKTSQRKPKHIPEEEDAEA